MLGKGDYVTDETRKMKCGFRGWVSGRGEGLSKEEVGRGYLPEPEWSWSLLGRSLEGWGPPDSSRGQFAFHDLQLLLAELL